MDLSWVKDFLEMFVDYLKPYVVVNEYQEAVILRNGKYNRTLKPGLWYKHSVFEFYLLVNVKPDTLEFEPICITTLDGKTVIIGLEVEFEIIDSKKYAVETNDAPSNMRDIARGEMSDYLEDIYWADIKKKTTKNALKRLISYRYEEIGVKLRDLKFTNKCESRSYRLFSERGNIINAI